MSYEADHFYHFVKGVLRAKVSDAVKLRTIEAEFERIAKLLKP